METLAKPDLLGLTAHLLGTALFAGVFMFLYREARTIYFGYWASAWGLLSVGLLWNLIAVVTGRLFVLFPYALFELAFASSIFFAAASVFGKFDLHLPWQAAAVPVLMVVGYALGLFSGFSGFYAMTSLLLTGAYSWNFVAFHRRWRSKRGSGRKLFSAALLASALLNANYALLYGSARLGGSVMAQLRFQDLFDLFLQTVLAFSGMMMWMETQNEKLEELNAELEQSRSEIVSNARTDRLTGLLNRITLDQYCESGEQVNGTVVVIDLDNFKDINDALGHMAGDDVLANVGGLIKTSVRKEDDAWRWGGDEFVVLFRNQMMDSVEARMRGFQERLSRFRLRGKGALPIHLSWGAAEVHGRSLRDAIDDADRSMYLRKREKATASKFFGGE